MNRIFPDSGPGDAELDPYNTEGEERADCDICGGNFPTGDISECFACGANCCLSCNRIKDGDLVCDECVDK